jgi:hypothetical protein
VRVPSGYLVCPRASLRHASACATREPRCPRLRLWAGLERLGYSASRCKLGIEAPASFGASGVFFGCPLNIRVLVDSRFRTPRGRALA